MKNIIILSMLFIGSVAYSQYSIPLRLVNSSGAPLTGQASNIVFTRYPHIFGTDNVSGLTITEVGTAGNYVCKGFTTYEYVKLWLSGVNQSWFDSVQVGNITSYISSNYILKAGSVTGITGNKTISSGNWLWSGSNTTMYKPFLEGSSPWVTDYSQMVGTSLVHVTYADSMYGIKPYYISGSNIILLGGKKIWGTSLSQPIQLNTSHFTWSTSTGLNITLPYQQDSLYVKKDTIYDENTYTKSWSLKRRFFSQTNQYTLKWYYKNSTDGATDSAQAINNNFEVDNETSVSVGYGSVYVKVDSLLLDAGTYTINFGMNFERTDPNSVSAVGIKDTVELALKLENTGTNTYIKRHLYDIFMYPATNSMNGGVMNWSAAYTVPSNKTYVYIYARYLATALSNALSVGTTVKIIRSYAVATLVK